MSLESPSSSSSRVPLKPIDYSKLKPNQIGLLLDVLIKFIIPEETQLLFRAELLDDKMIKFETDLLRAVESPIQEQPETLAIVIETIVTTLSDVDVEQSLYCAHFLKQIMLKSNLLEQQNMTSYFNWTIFLTGLIAKLSDHKKILERLAVQDGLTLPKFADLPQDEITDLYLQLCGEFLKNGSELYVRLIHQVMYLLKRNVGESLDAGGMLIGGVLNSFMKIKGNLNAVLPIVLNPLQSSDNEQMKTYLMKAESFFMKQMGTFLITLKLFDEPFDAARGKYLNHFQDPSQIEAVQKKFWANPLAFWQSSSIPRVPSGSLSSSSIESIASTDIPTTPPSPRFSTSTSSSSSSSSNSPSSGGLAALLGFTKKKSSSKKTSKAPDGSRQASHPTRRRGSFSNSPPLASASAVYIPPLFPSAHPPAEKAEKAEKEALIEQLSGLMSPRPSGGSEHPSEIATLTQQIRHLGLLAGPPPLPSRRKHKVVYVTNPLHSSSSSTSVPPPKPAKPRNLTPLPSGESFVVEHQRASETRRRSNSTPEGSPRAEEDNTSDSLTPRSGSPR